MHIYRINLIQLNISLHVSNKQAHDREFTSVHAALFVHLWGCPAADTTRLAAYNHPPSSSVGSHVLIPSNLSVLSSTNIIS
jgi:hypothetical protein